MNVLLISYTILSYIIIFIYNVTYCIFIVIYHYHNIYIYYYKMNYNNI